MEQSCFDVQMDLYMDVELSNTAMLGGQVPCGQSQLSSCCSKKALTTIIRNPWSTLNPHCHLMGLVSPVQLNVLSVTLLNQFGTVCNTQFFGLECLRLG